MMSKHEPWSCTSSVPLLQYFQKNSNGLFSCNTILFVISITAPFSVFSVYVAAVSKIFVSFYKRDHPLLCKRHLIALRASKSEQDGGRSFNQKRNTWSLCSWLNKRMVHFRIIVIIIHIVYSLIITIDACSPSAGQDVSLCLMLGLLPLQLMVIWQIRNGQ